MTGRADATGAGAAAHGTGGALPPYRAAVRDEWIDYNGHLSEAYYVLLFGHATDAVWEHAGVGPAYVRRQGCSLYTVEAHVRYLHEVGRAATPEVTSHVVGVEPKKVHLCHEMVVGGEVVATEEILAVHVDQRAGRAAPLPAPARDVLAGLVESPPEYSGRALGRPTSRPS